jgi:aconitate hydratase 2/2-methylisocitrate dehydratase
MFIQPNNPVAKTGQGYSLAQKMVGKACGVDGILPGTACEPKMTTVGSQDTTGPMTADEIKELACLKFQAPMFMQSFCHTAAYPKPADVKMHNTLPAFIAEREGVALRPGDGVIHSWLNRLLLPDTVGTGGDSHTRFPIGISFPAGSGLIAFAGALGFMALDMPESVLVRFKGEFNEGITLRDAVNAIPYYAIKQGLLTVPKKNKVNIFNGRILEMEGLPNLSVEQAFELTDAAAERSAAAGCIQLSEESVCTYLRSNVALMESMIKDGYEHAATLQKRIDAVNEWLKDPKLLKADSNAEYAAVIEIDLAEITEPILACPNDPDDVKLLSEVQGTKIQDIFLGSCMTNIGHFRAAAKIWEGNKFNPEDRIWICPPTRMDQAKLKDEAYFAIFNQVGARIETPGCSLCMGNQARVPDGVNMFSTSTRNFDDRIGNGAQVYLGSAELGAVTALKGELPTPAEYLAVYKEKVAPCKEEVYDYLQFDELGEFDAVYKRCDI